MHVDGSPWIREGGQGKVIRQLQRPSWIGLLRWEETSLTQQTCTSLDSQRPSLVSPSPFVHVRVHVNILGCRELVGEAPRFEGEAGDWH